MEVDKNLIIRCKRYDKTAFVELFKLYQRYLYSICYSYTQNEQDSLDIVQEIYIKIFKNIGNFNINMPFHPWIRRITVNACLNFKRGIKTNVVSLNSKQNDNSEFEETLASDYDLENVLERKELQQIIKSGLNSLPDNYRLIITLRYFEDLSYQEIADLIHKPLGTIKTDLYRGKAMLKKLFEDRLEG